jgi:stage IV sporulation protein FB
MQDPFTWAFPLGRFFGIPVKVNVLFPLVAAGLILRAAFQKDVPSGSWIDAAMLMALLFVVVLLHEFGHCFGARAVDGDAQEVMMWPLGGLAFVDVPHTPRANFIATVAGPAVNVVICVVSGLLFCWMTNFQIRLPLNPIPAGPPLGWSPYRIDDAGTILLYKWDGSLPESGIVPMPTPLAWVVTARLFWVSWVTLLLNVVVPGFPLDGGRMFQCAVWWRTDYRRGTLAAVYAGFIAALVFGIVAILGNELLALCLALFIYVACRRQWVILEGGGEDSLLGYDFSQGYTSLERDQPPPRRRRPRPNFWQRWWQRRAQRKRQQQEQQKIAEERRMDQLLEKVQRDGLHSLTDEERRFLKRVSDKYKNRQ